MNSQIHYISKAIRKWLFARTFRTCKQHDFCIISNNCIAALPYQFLKLEYNTPTIGLFFYAPCFIKFARNLDYYLAQDLIFKEVSMYAEGEESRKKHGFYPVGRLDDIEIHFMHYESETEAKEKWERRIRRLNKERLFFLMTDTDLFERKTLEEFCELEYERKVCLTAQEYNLSCSVQIKAFRNQNCLGDVYTNYDLLLGSFDFSKWLSDK